jgi:hypothetical protein
MRSIFILLYYIIKCAVYIICHITLLHAQAPQQSIRRSDSHLLHYTLLLILLFIILKYYMRHMTAHPTIRPPLASERAATLPPPAQILQSQPHNAIIYSIYQGTENFCIQHTEFFSTFFVPVGGGGGRRGAGTDDLSPPRRGGRGGGGGGRRHDSDSDVSPPRKRQDGAPLDSSPPRFFFCLSLSLPPSLPSSACLRACL